MAYEEKEREESNAVLANKVEQILETVHEIKDKLTRNEDNIHIVQREIDQIKFMNSEQEKRLDKQDKKQDDMKKYIWGIIGTIATTLIVWLLQFIFKINV